MIPELRSLLKEVFHQTHTKEQSLVLSSVSALRWFLGWWVSWKLDSALLQVAELSPRDQRGYWFVVAAASIVARSAAVQICSKFSKHLEGKSWNCCWWFNCSWMAWKFETQENGEKLQVSLSLSVNLTMPIPKDFRTAVWSIDADMLISKRFQPGQAFACTLCETLPTFTTAISASVTPLIFVGIYSAAGNFAKREAIRRTWSRIFEQQGFQVKFFLGVWAGCFSFFFWKIE